MISSRELALKILYNVENENAYSNLQLNKQLNKYELSSTEKSFVTELVYGVIKWKLNIDWIIRQFSKVRIKKISPWVLNILRIAIYQIKFLDKVPISAAVNESVKLTKKYSNIGSVKFVNGLLRNYSRNIDNIQYPKRSDKVKYLSVVYSHPEWLVQKWLNEYGYEFTENLLKANNEVGQLNIRVNTLKCTKNELVELLKSEGVEVHNGLYFDDSLIIKSKQSINKLKAFKDGLFQVQDESSIMVGKVLNPKEEQSIVDVCAAPGGKSTHLAELMKNKGQVYSRDIHEHKIKLINDNAKRLGIDIINTKIYDATKIDNDLIGASDSVLIDAPCSGLGIIRGKPDIKWNRSIEDTKSLVGTQKQILNASSKYVKSGGTLVYSTCTIGNEENIDIVSDFLEHNNDFELVDITDCIPEKLRTDTCKHGYIQTYPNIHNIDGFFVAKMKKINN